MCSRNMLYVFMRGCKAGGGVAVSVTADWVMHKKIALQ